MGRDWGTREQQNWLARLSHHLHEVGSLEVALPAERDRELHAIRDRYAQLAEEKQTQLRQLDLQLRGEYLRYTSEAVQQHDEEVEQLTKVYEAELKKLHATHRKQRQELEYERFLGERQLRRELDAARQDEEQRTRDAMALLQDLQDQTDDFAAEFAEEIVLRGVEAELPVSSDSATKTTADPQRAAVEALQRARQALHDLRTYPCVVALDQRWFWLLGGIGALAFVILSATVFGPRWSTWFVVRWIAVGWLILAAARVSAKWLAMLAAQRRGPEIAAEVARTRVCLRAARAAEGERHRQTGVDLQQKNQQRLADLRSESTQQLDQRDVTYDVARTRAHEEFSNARQRVSQALMEKNRSLKQQYLPQIDQAKLEMTEQLTQWQAAEEQAASAVVRRFERRWDEFLRRTQETRRDLSTQALEQHRRVDQCYPEIDAVDWNRWQPASDLAAARRIPFGQYSVHLSGMVESLPQADQLKWDTDSVCLPAVMLVPDQPNLFVEHDESGRESANQVLQAVLLKMLAAFPPGQLRMTLVDPHSLGQTFSVFMHLKEYDERVTGERIWTEPRQLEQVLAKIATHIETVIQQYLRTDYENILDYNLQAGEVAVPFQALVISGFPENFSEQSAWWLQKILVSGPRCGVITLMAADAEAELPRGISLEPFRNHAQVVELAGDRCRWRCPELSEYPLRLFTPPAEPLFSQTVHELGRKIHAARQVQLAFEVIVPDQRAWWSGDTAEGIDIPLGRAGANRLQHLRLGAGTSQHVLIAGKTGSGKSSLFHTLITNAALSYSPQQLQFYLMDFKKGVEFKTYAQQQLPHARVIAIESEREFGLSVLERLDRELQRRGELYRHAGAQTLADFRAAQPGTPMPRLLVIIDEFQELFVNEDKIAAEASLLLDRLVRQGRAFGIHVVLGSQTLAGAYSLARSTLGQMTVRIALQCSSADTHLILSDDNEAARFLARPGEAIYNDCNGQVQGNSEFQVAWLPADKKRRYLEELSSLARAQPAAREPLVVFEGNTTADITANRLLSGALQAPPPAHIPLAPRGWVGEAIAIKEPPAVVFQRRPGSHLLIVGQDDRAAHATLTSCVAGVCTFLPAAAFTADASPTFLVADDLHHDSAFVREWRPLEQSCPQLFDFLRRDGMADVVRHLAEELQQRKQSQQSVQPPKFLVLDDLVSLHELEVGDDELGFGGWEESPSQSPSQVLAELLRDGPTHGIHVLARAESYHRSQRFFGRSGLREFGTRVLFQMSAMDSTQLIDDPAASQLGPHRALLYREQDGTLERFRPYAQPDLCWLEGLGHHLQQRLSQVSDQGRQRQ